MSTYDSLIKFNNISNFSYPVWHFSGNQLQLYISCIDNLCTSSGRWRRSEVAGQVFAPTWLRGTFHHKLISLALTVSRPIQPSQFKKRPKYHSSIHPSIFLFSVEVMTSTECALVWVSSLGRHIFHTSLFLVARFMKQQSSKWNWHNLYDPLLSFFKGHPSLGRP